MKLTTEKKLALLEQKKIQINEQINKLKEENINVLASALNTITEIENIDINIVLGSVLTSIKNIEEEQKEVLRNSGKAFLKKYKARIYTSQKTNSKEK